MNATSTVNGLSKAAEQELKGAYWTGALAAAVAWYLASGNRDHLKQTYRDYLKRGASPDVRAHLDAIWKGERK